MYVLNIIDKKICKMSNFELSEFLNDCSKGEVQIDDHLFMPNKKLATHFIKNILKEEVPKCDCWK